MNIIFNPEEVSYLLTGGLATLAVLLMYKNTNGEKRMYIENWSQNKRAQKGGGNNE